MKKFAVIGFPLTHSLSPDIHNHAFMQRGIPARYQKIEIVPEQFEKIIRQLKGEEYGGFNITIPFKNRVISWLDDVDSDVAAIEAANTIVVENGRWKGYNTDIAGFVAPLQALDRQVKNCLILGAGGAARAVIYALGNYLKVDELTVAARRKTQAEQLIERLHSHCPATRLKSAALDGKESDLTEFDLVVNTTPLGTYPNITQTPLPSLKRLKNNAVVYDLVYNPDQTCLLADALKTGKDIRVISGGEMLIRQADAAFQLWTGQSMPYESVRTHLKKILEKAR
ncbi:MAG: shikimate dehydrogenase [Calditrichales bacterium]|nr:MAG: shikimate dehydrogenase [Calditrichales bacterium]